MTAPRFAPLVLDVGRPLPAVDLGAADHWAVVLTYAGRPIEHVWLPSPGAAQDPSDLLDALFGRAGARAAAEARLRERLCARLGASATTYPPLSCSVVVCTHGRPEFLDGLLRSLAHLDPAPSEVVIVDNAPGAVDCRDLVREAGFRYVREDRKGLDHARRAGLAAARGDLVAFTDDDCLPARTWLAALPELFFDRSVGAVTGPGFAYELETPPQVRFEEVDGFNRGLRTRAYDLLGLDPVFAGQLGAGANMVFRRGVLLALDDPFPAELDAGTPTRSGGDLTALARTLAAGHRVIYDPRLHVQHRHRRDARSLHDTFHGYGVGMTSGLLKLLVEDGELLAPLAWSWLVRQYLGRLMDRARGRGDALDVRIGWNYLAGGLAAPAALVRARRAAGLRAVPRRGGDVPPRPASSGQHGAAARARRGVRGGSAAGAPDFSVVIPTRARPGALARCLGALTAQDGPSFEVVVVDDDEPASATPDRDADVPLRVVRTGGAGPGAARNAGARVARGDVLLFLDDDLVPGPGLLAAHRRRHDDAVDRVVVGFSDPRPTAGTLAARAMVLWWQEHFARKERAIALTFADVLTGNMSVRRTAFERVGGFDEELGTLRREDWEWGCRVLEGGLDVVYAPEAVTRHEFAATTRGAVGSAFREGAGDALLVRKHPKIGWSGPHDTSLRRALRHPLHGLLALGCRRCAVRSVAVPLLAVLERVRARRWWARLYGLVLAGAWHDGFARHAGPAAPEVTRVVELVGTEPVPPPGPTCPTVAVHVRGEQVATVRPRDAQWHPRLADDVLGALAPEAWEDVVADGAPPPPPRRLDDVTMLFAWDAPTAAARARLEEAGAEVVALGAPPPGGRWQALDAAVRAAARPFVAVPMPGICPEPEWTGLLRVALDGPRVSLALGVGREAGLAPPLRLFSDRRHAELRLLELAPQCVLLRRKRLLALGGFDPEVAPAGHQGQVLDVLERSLAAGDVVGYQEAAGLGVADVRSVVVREQRQRVLGQGALVCRRALRARGVPGAAFFVRHAVLAPAQRVRRTPTRQTVRTEVGRGLFFAWGVAAMLAAQRGRSTVQRTGGDSTPLPATRPVTVSGTTPQRKS